jgi:hypothetical protein
LTGPQANSASSGEAAEEIISYSTEGLQLLTFNTGISWGNFDLFRFSLQRPWENIPSQQNLLEAYEKSEVTGLENLSFAFSPAVLGYPLAIYDKRSTLNWILGAILSAEYSQTVSRYHGTGRAEQAFTFLTEDGQTSDFAPGDELSFSSTIVTREYTVDLLGGMFAGYGLDLNLGDAFDAALDGKWYHFFMALLSKSPQIRLGIFETTYRRPTAFGNDLTTAEPLR